MARPAVKFTQLFINNEYVNSSSGKTFETIDPSTEGVICHVQEGDAADIDKAVKAAKKAFALNSPWRTMNASERGRLLLVLADLIEENSDYIASLESMDNGKPHDAACADVRFGVNIARYFAGYADKIHGKVIPADGNVVCWTRHEPVGVVGAIIPWNFPFQLAVLKIAPAVACGCTIVLKPAEQTPLTAIFLGSLVKQAGFPPGVINIVPGFGETAGAALVNHPDANCIAFTGSTAVGKLIMQTAAVHTKRVSLELGGKSPLIICDDADFDKATKCAFENVMFNAGQVCLAPTRTFVQAGIYDKFVERMKEMALTRKVGDPFDKSSVQGPQVSQTQFDTVMKYIECGKKEGARLVTGGARLGEKGYFIQPTVFADVTDDMRIAREEIFGPVQCVLKFNTFEEAIERANNTTYGLGAGIFTTDMDKAMRASQALQAGTVWINSYLDLSAPCSFGGFKCSGIGREMGKYNLEHFLEVKTISMPVSVKNS
ncbi:hypothetical protein SprV_0100004000 [Sparganum proliferum]